jgi:energy-coupling factor transporter transmembrane protein EcfT
MNENEREASMTLKKKLAFGGSIAMIIGVFMPIVQIPIVGSIDYFRNGKGDGVIVLVLGVVSLLIAFSNKYGWLWVTGVASLATMGFTLVNFSSTLAQTQANLNTELAGNPFGSLATAMFQSVRLQWGWLPLIGGAIVLLIAAGMKTELLSPVQGPQGPNNMTGQMSSDGNPTHWSDGPAADPKCLACDSAGICKLLDSSSPNCPKYEAGSAS